VDLSMSLEKTAAFLDSNGYRWALIGGLAMQAYGLSRATQDVDLVVEGTACEAVVAHMRSLGFETLHVSEGFSNHLHQALGRVDFAYVDAATAERLFAACRQMTGILGRAVAVPSPEHLIAMKVHAAKNDPSRAFREMADIEHLLRQPGVKPADVRRYFDAAGLTRWFDDLTR
jgi:hypothetical protein